MIKAASDMQSLLFEWINIDFVEYLHRSFLEVSMIDSQTEKED
jgi:hypothetical protein